MGAYGKNFYEQYKNTAIDYDGVYGVQCVDLFKIQCKELGKKIGAIGGSGYAREIYHRFNALGLSKIFSRHATGSKSMVYGDWVVWERGSADCPDSHVGMFVGWNGDRVKVFGYNQAGKATASIVSLTTDGLLGFLHPLVMNNGAKEVTDALVKEVIYGKWGNGQARIEKLEAAGYDADEVQAAVNASLAVKPKTVTAEIVNAVIRGDYGNGAARKANLEKAGYDYEEVQRAVNEKLS